jgi:two-component system, OmpR family, sensor kinase
LIMWGLGALGVGAPVLVLAAYLLTLGEIDEALDESLQQTALLLADRDLRTLPSESAASAVSTSDTESALVAIARRPDGSLLFSSQPERVLRFEMTPGASLQRADDLLWHVYSVVQNDRVIQVAQPVSVRQQAAAESASKLVLPLALLLAVIGAMLVAALRRGMRPLSVVNEALAQRNAESLAPLDIRGVAGVMQAFGAPLNDLLQRLAKALAAQRNIVA